MKRSQMWQRRSTVNKLSVQRGMHGGQVSTVASGEIDYEELEEQLAANVDRPAIINVNIGTTASSLFLPPSVFRAPVHLRAPTKPA